MNIKHVYVLLLSILDKIDSENYEETNLKLHYYTQRNSEYSVSSDLHLNVKKHEEQLAISAIYNLKYKLNNSDGRLSENLLNPFYYRTKRLTSFNETIESNHANKTESNFNISTEPSIVLITNSDPITTENEARLSYNKNITPLSPWQPLNQPDNKAVVRVRTSGELKFLEVPPGGEMTTTDLDLNKGYSIFTFTSGLVAGLQTSDFPAALLRDWVWNQLSTLQLITQVVRFEGGIIGVVLCCLLCAVALPVAVLAHTSCGFASPTNVASPLGRDLTDTQLHFRKLVLLVLFDLVLLLTPLGIIGMFLANEHLNNSVKQSSSVAESVINDVNIFIRNTHLQVRFVATTSIDIAVGATIADLEDAEALLGRPVQREFAAETGVDVALDALTDICTASTDIASEVAALRAEAQAAKEAARTCQERLKELRRQVDTAKRQCGEQDRNLCDTIDTGGLEIIFSVDKLLTERKLARLKHLGDDNMTSAAENARLTYQNIPQGIVENTSFIRQGACFCILFIWLLLTSASICVHCNCATRILPTLLSALIFICLCSIILWPAASVTLIAGGNGEVLFCRPLYDDPNWATLTLLLDNPGMVFRKGGLFSNIIKGNKSMDVPIKVILSECRLNQPAFPAFALNRIVNIDSLTNHLTWPKLHGHINNISVNINNTQILKPNLQKYLQDLSQASRVNLTLYRTQLSGSITTTDLNTFADQLERIANQMSDLPTSARMETLAARSRKLLTNNLQRLEKHRDEIIYRLTALEVHLLPLQRQANQSLSHLKTIQFYLTNQGANISQKKTNEYVTRLVRYLERFREHVLNQLTYEIAPCLPIWNSFDASRMHLCRNIVEPTNGFFISTIWCLILFIFVTPLTMILIKHYRYILSNGELQRDLNELLLLEQGRWHTPQDTPESIASPEQSSWATPRRQSEQLLIPPPRRTPELYPPEAPSFRRLIQATVQAQVAARPRIHESLRMIESSTWRNHNIPAPRGWL